MTEPAVNPWRGETLANLKSGAVPLRCRMDTFARLLEATGETTMAGLYRAWDSLNPAKLQPSFRLLAETPAEADRAWSRLAGVEDMMRLRAAFYRVTSGQDPDQIREAEEAEKKAGNLLPLMAE